MIRIQYQNELGCLMLGASTGYPLTLTGLSGFSPPGREYFGRTYLGIDGQMTLSSRVLPRTVTISFERHPDFSMTAREIVHILSSVGTLSVLTDDGTFCLKTNRVTVSEIKRNGDYLLFSAQFVCDDPFFTEPSARRVTCYETKKNIRFENGAWNLGTRQNPVVWTATNSVKTIVNDGDAPCEPTIVLSGFGTPSEKAEMTFRIESENGKILSEITLHYGVSDGETVTVCCDGRNENGRFIRSSRNGDILSVKSSETSLSKFRIPVGKSVFRLIYRSESGKVKAYADYAVRYEGVSLWK